MLGKGDSACGCHEGTAAGAHAIGDAAPFPDVMAGFRSVRRPRSVLVAGSVAALAQSMEHESPQVSPNRVTMPDRPREMIRREPINLAGCYTGQRSILSRHVVQLKDQCRIYLGTMPTGTKIRQLAAEVPKGYRPVTEKDAMFRAFLPEYMYADRVDWTTLRNNIVSVQHDEVERTAVGMQPSRPASSSQPPVARQRSISISRANVRSPTAITPKP